MSMHALMSRNQDARREALLRNYQTIKDERERMANAYAKNGSSVAGQINLEQFDRQLERLRDELAQMGEMVDVDQRAVEAVRPSAMDDERQQTPPVVQQRPVVRVRRATLRQSEG